MPDPDARYASAAALDDDLERHLRSLPLRHVREPSLVERAAKWLAAPSWRYVRDRHRFGSGTAGGPDGRGARGPRQPAGGIRGICRAGRFPQRFSCRADRCSTPRFAALARLAKVDEACRKALDHFRVLDDPAWSDAAVFQHLSRQGQDEARADIGELLFLLAAVTRLDADGALPDRQQAAIDRAMELNRRAEGAWPAGACAGSDLATTGELSRRSG